MRILVCPDSLKGSLTAPAAADAIDRGIRKTGSDARIDLCPLADGGEGTVAALVRATSGRIVPARVTGPLGEPVTARIGLLGDGRTAAVEMAAAAGLPLVPEEARDPTRTTTFGVGELILAALATGRKRLVIGVGGSATCDGGAGMAQAIGVALPGAPVPCPGGALASIESVDLAGRDPRVAAAEIVVACDVRNPLAGPRGAAAVYGPQKGATPEQVEALDAGLRHLASLCPDADPDAPGAGAAGGLGFGLAAFCGARLTSGVELVMDAVGFRDRLGRADLAITAEGRLDATSAEGKVTGAVAKAAEEADVPAIALVGEVAGGAETSRFVAVHALRRAGTPRAASTQNAEALLVRSTRAVVRRLEVAGSGRVTFRQIFAAVLFLWFVMMVPVLIHDSIRRDEAAETLCAGGWLMAHGALLCAGIWRVRPLPRHLWLFRRVTWFVLVQAVGYVVGMAFLVHSGGTGPGPPLATDTSLFGLVGLLCAGLVIALPVLAGKLLRRARFAGILFAGEAIGPVGVAFLAIVSMVSGWCS